MSADRHIPPSRQQYIISSPPSSPPPLLPSCAFPPASSSTPATGMSGLELGLAIAGLVSTGAMPLLTSAVKRYRRTRGHTRPAATATPPPPAYEDVYPPPEYYAYAYAVAPPSEQKRADRHRGQDKGKQRRAGKTAAVGEVYYLQNASAASWPSAHGSIYQLQNPSACSWTDAGGGTYASRPPLSPPTGWCYGAGCTACSYAYSPCCCAYAYRCCGQ